VRERAQALIEVAHQDDREMLMEQAKERGLQGFTSGVLASNTGMMKVFQNKSPVKAIMELGEYHLTIPFESSFKITKSMAEKEKIGIPPELTVFQN
jgi:hypothetical protein